MTDPGYQIYQRMSTATHGELIKIDRKSDVADLFVQLMRFQYSAETLMHVSGFSDNIYEIYRDPGVFNYYLHAIGGITVSRSMHAQKRSFQIL
jgi:hypothetical protein